MKYSKFLALATYLLIVVPLLLAGCGGNGIVHCFNASGIVVKEPRFYEFVLK